jgi:hypothetical protein
MLYFQKVVWLWLGREDTAPGRQNAQVIGVASRPAMLAEWCHAHL